MKALFHIAAHELRLTFREPKFWIPFFFPPVLLIASQLALLPEERSPEILSKMMLFCSLLISPMIVPLASDSFAGERERGSLELLLLLPVRPSTVFYGKLLALLPVPVFFVLLACAAYAFAADFWNFAYVWKTALAGIWASVLFSGLALFVSLRVKTARSANQISVLFVFLILAAASAFSDAYFSKPFAPLLLSLFAVVFFFALSALSFRRFREF